MPAVILGIYGTGTTDPWALGVVVALLAAVHGREWVRDHWPLLGEEDPQEVLRQRYVDGEIGLLEYERELELLMDTSNERIRERVEVVEGIGPVVSREVALAFESVGHLERADRADLLAVDDVGPQRADDILSEVQDGG